jgi:hypothetical protein
MWAQLLWCGMACACNHCMFNMPRHTDSSPATLAVLGMSSVTIRFPAVHAHACRSDT